MQDEGSAKGLEAAFQKHWDKMAIGVVFLASVVYLGSRFAGSGPTEEAAVDKVADLVKRQLAARNEKIAGPRPFKQVSETAAEAISKPQPFTPGPRTKYTYTYEKVDERRVEFVIPGVQLDSATPSFEGVQLAWSLVEMKSDPTVRGQHTVDPKTFYFQIERQSKNASWKVIRPKLKIKDNKDLKFRDTETQPKSDYEYRVTLGSDDPKWLARKNAGRDPGLLNRPSNPLAAHTPGIFIFKFDNFQKDLEADPPVKGTAWITITKHDPVAGEVKINYIHTEGDRIGWKPNEKGELTSKHRVTSARTGRSVEVDFNSGAVFQKVTLNKRVKYKYKECQIVFGNVGPECQGTIEKEGEYYANEAAYLDEDKNLVIDQRPVGAGPKADQLCLDHGGTPPPRVEEKPAAEREDTAKKLLAEAEALWITEKPTERKKAQKIYKELLDKYADTEAMKVRKYQAETRLKETIK